MKRMVGYDSEGDSLDSDKLRHYILGGHVADYMRYLNEEDEEKYKSHFSRFIKKGLTSDSVSYGLEVLQFLTSLFPTKARAALS